MTTFSRLLLLAAVCMLTAFPVHAQSGAKAQASGTSGNTSVTLSDKSGASATNIESVFFESDETQIRMNDVASTLTQALRSGTLGPSVVPGSQPVPVSPMVADLLNAASPEDVTAATQQFMDVLAAMNLPAKEANALVRAVTGLLEDGTVSPRQVQEALNAYNAAVDAAPAAFLAQPPHEFIVVRAVLMTLLEGAV